MEFIFAMLIVAAIYIIPLMRKLSSTEVEDSDLPRSIMGDAFPAIEVVDEREQPAPRPKQKTTKKAHASYKPAAPIAAAADEPVVQEPAPEKKNHFAIKSKSDAKRAIIYSEIFNRKYN